MKEDQRRLFTMSGANALHERARVSVRVCALASEAYRRNGNDGKQPRRTRDQTVNGRGADGKRHRGHAAGARVV
jgi:hypothetical protein